MVVKSKRGPAAAYPQAMCDAQPGGSTKLPLRPFAGPSQCPRHRFAQAPEFELLHLCDADHARAYDCGLLSGSDLDVINHVRAPHMAACAIRYDATLADLEEDRAGSRRDTNLVRLCSKCASSLR